MKLKMMILLIGCALSSNAQSSFTDSAIIYKIIKKSIEHSVAKSVNVYNQTSFDKDLAYKNIGGAFDIKGKELLKKDKWKIFLSQVDTTLASTSRVINRGQVPLFKNSSRNTVYVRFSPILFSGDGGLALLSARITSKTNKYSAAFYLERVAGKWSLIHQYTYEFAD